MALLSITDVTVRFGGLVANNAITLAVPEGSLFAVIGPNGAGKTTLFNVISGAFQPTEGKISFAGDNITGKPQTDIASRGLIRTYQLVQLFKDLSVSENVQVGAHRVTRGGILAALMRPGWARMQETAVRDEAERLLDFVGLGGRGEMQADQLPYGQQRLLEVARAMAAKPRIILLDEPAAGLNTQETQALADVIKRIHATGVTVLLIEHDMSLVMQVAQRIAVLDFGRKIAEGTPDEVRKHPAVLEAYLGGTEHSLV
jgi:branched-chain amino acid transport system ATP-binding protein